MPAMVVQPADARLRVRISTVSGRVTVTAEPRSGVVVDRGGVAQASADGAVEIRAGRPRESVEVRCPEGADVIVGTRSGSIELLGRFGTVGVTSQSGSIRVAAAMEADLRTVSGGLELESCEGRCRLSTTSGRITVGVTHDAEISTTSGKIAVDHATGTVQVRSVSGSVRVASEAHGPVTASTVSGSITIHLPRGVRPKVRTSGLGKVRNGFEAGDDMVVDVANVSGTIRLVPA
jgi:Putative adhesin